jgi:phage host-nuclease inhibitor protein Gam
MLPMEVLKSKEEAAEAVKRYAHLLAEMGMLASQRDKATLAITEKFQPLFDAKSAIATDLKGQLQLWAENNPEAFGDGRSVEFAYGWARFRKGNRKLVLLARWTWDKVLQTLLDKPPTSQWQEYIRRTPEINKQKLLTDTKAEGKMPEAKLRDIGVRVVREESFEIETKPDMVAKDCDLMP